MSGAPEGLTPEHLYARPNALAPHYSRFKVAERLLLTGHSHQAWPDVAFAGQQQAWLDAAALVDDKWPRAEEEAERVRAGYRRLLSDPGAEVALGHNTHELVTRLLSALPLRSRPRLVTTDAEFHSIRRLLDRLAEEGIEVVKVPARPVASVAERLAAAVDERTACAMISSVYYETAEIVPQLEAIADACRKRGVALLVDAYHHLNVVPFDIEALGLADAYVTAGGYKYCQLGEGNACLRLPPHCRLRPVLTGWFGEFTARDRAPAAGKVSYGRGAARFAGATYDPTSHYRAAAVFAFHARMRLTPDMLRAVSVHQVTLLEEAVRALDVDAAFAHVIDIEPAGRAGFLAIRSPHAARLCAALRERDVLTDSRADVLRLGPAPYLADDQLREAVARLGEAVQALGGC